MPHVVRSGAKKLARAAVLVPFQLASGEPNARCPNLPCSPAYPSQPAGKLRQACLPAASSLRRKKLASKSWNGTRLVEVWLPRRLFPNVLSSLIWNAPSAQAARTLTHQNLLTRPKNLWRYAEVLPGCAPLTLGEGMTPLVPTERLGAAMGLKRLYVKDEALNPTGSFKARGMAVAVAQAKHLGAKTLAAPTAGNAGGALAAYAAA